MCGIAGFLTSRPPAELGEAELRRMMKMLVHRGPDGDGVFVEEGNPRVLFGHRRLSIIDLDTGAQPMSSNAGSPCAPVTITFNGEIYNYRELRPALEAKGHRFRTNSDTEVILHLYEEKGDACVEDLRGMFSFALWDARKRRLLAARDRLGVKPFVYRHDGATFAFASEIKALLTLPGVPRTPDPQALAMFLSFQYVPHPWTGFQGIRKLPPGHLLTVEDGRLEIRSYWRLQPQEKLRLQGPELEEAVRAQLDEAVRLRMISEVPLGAFLSGGLDSSAVAASMALQSKAPVQTFSIGFEEAAYDESAHARRVAKRIGADHHEETVRPDAMALLSKLAWHYDEPFADSSAIPTWQVSAHARRHVTVALTGDGGDEAFGGYPRYRANLAFERWKALPRWLRALPEALLKSLPGHDEKGLGRMARRFLEVSDSDPLRRYAHWVAFFDPVRRSALMTPEAHRAAGGLEPIEWLGALGAGFTDLADRMEAVDLQSYLPCALMTKVDIASMAHSLECRGPFLDHRLVGFAMRIPSEEKIGLRGGKLCLKRAMEPRLPAENIWRSKMGFAVPVSRWFRTEMSAFLRDTLLSQKALGRGLFRPEAVKTLLDEHISGRAYHAHRLWALLTLECWHRTWVDPADAPSSPTSL